MIEISLDVVSDVPPPPPFCVIETPFTFSDVISTTLKDASFPDKSPIIVLPVNVGPAKSAFKSKAVCCALDTGFPESDVLSTFPNPTPLADKAVVKLRV